MMYQPVRDMAARMPSTTLTTMDALRMSPQYSMLGAAGAWASAVSMGWLATWRSAAMIGCEAKTMCICSILSPQSMGETGWPKGTISTRLEIRQTRVWSRS